jgi:hypothetical protein
MSSDIETVCIGLKVAIHSSHFDVGTFRKIISNLRKINTQTNLGFYSKVVLDNTLRILEWFIKNNPSIRSYYLANQEEYNAILTTGLMSKNPVTRKMYCEAIEEVITGTVEDNF